MPSVGEAIPHDSARFHVTGSAAFLDDLPPLAGELFVDFVPAPIAAGRLQSIDAQEAMRLPGVMALFTAADLPIYHLPGRVNAFGPIFHDEPFLVADEISYVGQPVAVVAALDRHIARRAAAMVKLECEPSEPILSIDQAIAAGAFIGPRRVIRQGNVDAAFATAPHVLQGHLRTGGQEQLYFESQACIAIPGEGGSLRVIASTQNPSETQQVVAEALGLSLHQVVCECKRMGGGFGGKETQSAIPAVMAALVAHHTRRSARIVYRKDQDMIVTGKRHDYQTQYRAAFDDEGRLLAIDVEFHSNGGAFADLSTSVMERSMLHVDNAYRIPAARITGQVCRLNLPPNTAFRGFGGPQGVVVIENILQEIAITLGKDAWDIRRLNTYRDGDPQRSITPYGQVVRDHVLHETLDELERTSDYRRRIAEIARSHSSSDVTLRGIAMTQIKFGISFTTRFLNQGNALVNVFTDGSIQVSTGGTEMGQGLNTKIRQVVADQFGIDPDLVSLMNTSTEKNHNTSPTAASAGTDLNAMAATEACESIRRRMANYAAQRLADPERGLSPSAEHIRFERGMVFDTRDPLSSLPFGIFCDSARRDRIDLGARGFYATPGVDFNRETGKGTPFHYFTTGAAVAEVSIDRLTGETTIDRVDLLMDVGKMINPGIDHGQIIGGFVQGAGWCTMEELVHDHQGCLLSTSPTTYKIPNITDFPLTFNLATIENTKHRINVRRSKAVGEPPLMLGIAVWMAIKHALSCLDDKRSLYPLPLPATPAVILEAITKIRHTERQAPTHGGESQRSMAVSSAIKSPLRS